MREHRSGIIALVAMVIALVVALFFYTMPARATTQVNELNVDGATYAPTKVVGNGQTVHYDTPETNPNSAFTERNVWSGNGSENLPCAFGIHWIDNKNVLTVSHCLEGEQPSTTTTSTSSTSTSTTTSTSSTTTTTIEGTSTTITVPETTTSSSTTTTVLATTSTTSMPSTTTSEVSTTTTAPPTTTTTLITTTTTDPGELPNTGAGGIAALAVAGAGLLTLGALAIWRTESS